MPEERRISPALVIIPVALGLAALGVVAALALAAPPEVYTCPYCGDEFATEAELLAHIELEHPEMPPPDGVAEFTYVSDLVIVRTDSPTLYDIRWEVSVKNIGEEAGVLHLTIKLRMEDPGEPGHWSSWKEKDYSEATLALGETKTFSGTVKLSPYTYELMVESEAGTIIKPWRATQ